MALDTPPEIEERILEGYRRMTPQEKFRRIIELNRSVGSARGISPHRA